MADINELSILIETEIKNQYKSVRKFAEHIGIPQTTLVSALKSGIKGTAYDTVVRICEVLGIELINYKSHIVMTDDVMDLINMYNSLDEKGAHAVMAFTAMEFGRVRGTNDYIEQAVTKSNDLMQKKVFDSQSNLPPEPVIVG